MSTVQRPNIPGLSSLGTATPRRVFLDDEKSVAWLPSSEVIDGSKTRDSGNTGSLDIVRAGLLLGKISASGKYAPSIIGVTTGSLASNGTSITVSAAQAVELVRRVGATGTFKLTGPVTAGGTVRSLTATYSGVNTTTGVITITALGTNQVDHVRWAPAATGGNIQLTVQKADGTWVTTGNIAWNATDATFIASANTALDTATGVAGAIVASAISATDPDLGMALTYSGTGYAGKTFQTARLALLGTSSTTSYAVTQTAAVDGGFIAGSFVQPTDGSEAIITFVPDGEGIKVTDEYGVDSDTQFANVPVAGLVDSAQLLNWPSDTALRAWICSSMNSTATAKFVFNHLY